jgi:hypothetical protein
MVVVSSNPAQDRRTRCDISINFRQVGDFLFVSFLTLFLSRLCLYLFYYDVMVWFGFMVLNATYISVISWQLYWCRKPDYPEKYCKIIGKVKMETTTMWGLLVTLIILKDIKCLYHRTLQHLSKVEGWFAYTSFSLKC